MGICPMLLMGFTLLNSTLDSERGQDSLTCVESCPSSCCSAHTSTGGQFVQTSQRVSLLGMELQEPDYGESSGVFSELQEPGTCWQQ